MVIYREGYACLRAGSIWEIPVPPLNFVVNLIKSAPKIYLKKFLLVMIVSLEVD